MTHHVSYSPEAKETPVYLPELDSLSYGDTLYGSEYTVGRSSAAVTVTITFPSAERECQDLPRPLALVPSHQLEEELSYLKRAEALIRKGDLSAAMLQYSY